MTLCETNKTQLAENGDLMIALIQYPQTTHNDPGPRSKWRHKQMRIILQSSSEGFSADSELTLCSSPTSIRKSVYVGGNSGCAWGF